MYTTKFSDNYITHNDVTHRPLYNFAYANQTIQGGRS